MSETTAEAAIPCGCWPPPGMLRDFVDRARKGEHAVPVVGDGSPGTEIGCAHGTWVLGDVLGETGDAASTTCTETTKAGEPCQGRAGPDGRCAAHKET